MFYYALRNLQAFTKQVEIITTINGDFISYLYIKIVKNKINLF